MKKLMSYIAIVALVLTFTACGNKDNEVSLIRCYKCHVIFAHNSTPISIAKWNKGLNDFIDEQDYLLQKGKEDMWNSMPIVLRWLTKKYLSRKKKKS